MHYICEPPPYDLTYDDVFMVPRRSAVESRLAVDLATFDGTGTTIPVLVANMTAVAGRRMAETVARRGGLAVIPQDIPIDVVTEVVAWVKRRHLVHDTPITLAPTDTVSDALVLLPKRAHGAVVVVQDGRPVGVVTEVDCADVDRFTQLGAVMSRDLLTLPAEVDPEEAFNRLVAGHHRLAPVVDGNGRLVGILTRTGALRATLYRPAVDAENRLRVGAAIGITGDVASRADKLLAAGVDVLVVDTAHGHQDRMLAALRAVRGLRPAVPVAAAPYPGWFTVSCRPAGRRTPAACAAAAWRPAWAWHPPAARTRPRARRCGTARRRSPHRRRRPSPGTSARRPSRPPWPGGPPRPCPAPG